MSSMGNELVAGIFKALAHPTRLQIVKILRDRPLCVCDILAQLDSEQSNTSQHLSVLKSQGIVESKKDGQMVIYRIRSQQIYQIIDIAESVILQQIEETKAVLEGKRQDKEK